jgi:hypothetical protein
MLPDFVVFTDLGSFGQSEAVQRGPIIDGMIGVPMRAYGASSDGLVLHGVLGYVWSQNDALLDLASEASSRLESGRVVDQRGILRLRGASPRVPAIMGRFVFRTVWDVRHNDSQRTFVALGGDNALRGYPAQHFYTFGGSRLFGTLEYRSRPWLLQSVHLGVVGFYDAGTVYVRLANARFHHCVGAGLRVLFPQLNRTVFRFDVGVPLDSTGVAAQLTYGSDQLIPMTPAEDAISDSDQSSSVRQSL